MKSRRIMNFTPLTVGEIVDKVVAEHQKAKAEE